MEIISFPFSFHVRAISSSGTSGRRYLTLPDKRIPSIRLNRCFACHRMPAFCVHIDALTLQPANHQWIPVLSTFWRWKYKGDIHHKGVGGTYRVKRAWDLLLTFKRDICNTQSFNQKSQSFGFMSFIKPNMRNTSELWLYPNFSSAFISAAYESKMRTLDWNNGVLDFSVSWVIRCWLKRRSSSFRHCLSFMTEYNIHFETLQPTRWFFYHW